MYKNSYLLLLGVLVGFNFMKMNLAFAKPTPHTHVLQRISIPQSTYQMGIKEFAPNASKQHKNKPALNCVM